MNFVMYKGPSMLDNQPIVALAVVNSTNRKTGNMINVHIMREDMNPLAAKDTGSDSSVCGNCPLRQNVGGACYVNIGQGPHSAYKAYKRGKYAELTQDQILSKVMGNKVRLGAYGDPAALPYDVIAPIVEVADMVTSYTHQSGHPNFDKRILEYSMVSTETVNNTKRHHENGNRTFRVIPFNGEPLPNEIECKSDSDGITCAQCGLCNGGSKGPSVYITAHGTRAKKHSEKYGTIDVVSI